MDLNWLVYPISFIVTLGIVVTIHEFGHFIVARWAGVKVMRFAVGFGRPLYRWYDKHQTEFCFCAIPLGGYVRLLDSRQDEITVENQSGDLSSKSVYARLAIFAAGPFINILFAVLVFAVYAMLGITEVKPIVGLTEPNTPAFVAGLQSGDEIVEISGRQVSSWEQVSFQLIEAAGLDGRLSVRAERHEFGQIAVRDYSLKVSDFMAETSVNPLTELGIVPQIHLIPPRIGDIPEGMPAAVAGWQAEDLITRLDDKDITHWQDLYQYIRMHPNKDISFELLRDGEVITGTVHSESAMLEGQSEPVGKIGAGPKPPELNDNLVRQIKFGPIEALVYGFDQTWIRTRLVVLSIGKLFTGALSLDNVTGPVTIAEIAGKTAQIGVSSSLNFLAYLSISLGVFNLLPVPMLDGGHILFALIELVRGKPLSMKIQQRGMAIGFALLGALMVLALFNDMVRLFST